MKKIQQKLRELLGNDGISPKHLATGNLPDRSKVTSIWQEASGVIYKAHLLYHPSLTLTPLKIFQNPYGLEIGSMIKGTAFLQIDFNGIPTSAKIKSDNLDFNCMAGDNIGAFGGDKVAVFTNMGTTYQAEYNRIVLMIGGYNLLTGAALNFHTQGVAFFLEIKAY